MPLPALHHAPPRCCLCPPPRAALQGEEGRGMGSAAGREEGVGGGAGAIGRGGGYGSEEEEGRDGGR